MESSAFRKTFRKEEIINLVIMGFLSFFLLFRMLLGPLTPVPIVLMVLNLGRSVGYLFLGGLALIFLVLGLSSGSAAAIVPIFCMLGLSAALAEAIFRKVPPKKVFGRGFLALMTIMLLSFGSIFLAVDRPLEKLQVETKKELIKQTEVSKKVFGSQSEAGGAFTKYLENLTKNSEEITSEVINQIPFIFTLISVLLVWGNFLLILSLGKIGPLRRVDYPYSSKELLDFKVPEYCIWPFILALLAYLFESHVGLVGVAISTNILKILLIFYVLQGLGILIYLFNLAKIRGIFRILMFMIVLIQGPIILAALGIFDMWVNFRLFFKKRIEKYRGDNQR